MKLSNLIEIRHTDATLSKIRKSFGLLLCAITVSACASVTVPLPLVSEQQLAVAPKVMLAGELQQDAIDKLRGLDAVLIDLRLESEETRQEANNARAAGIRYEHLPVGKGVVTGQVTRLEDMLLLHKSRNVIVHCSSGNRAGMIWAAHLMEQGASVADALSAVETIVTKPKAKQAIEVYANNQLNLPD